LKKIYVDADASPVNDIVISIAKNANIPVVLVKSFDHFSHQEETVGVQTVYVDSGADAADYRIMELANHGDILITQDYGLASLGLGRDCIVLHPRGFAYTDTNIDQLLASRHVNAKARRSGQRTKGPKPFTDEDKQKFQALLVKTINKMIG